MYRPAARAAPSTPPERNTATMMRILHTADWQIGRQYGSFEPKDAAALADARFAVVERLTDLASTSGVDVVLVAGDVFDAQGVSPRTIRRLFNAMAVFNGPWVKLNFSLKTPSRLVMPHPQPRRVPAKADVCRSTADVGTCMPVLRCKPLPTQSPRQIA